ncbi:unnamed protein product [Rotaria sp. Silwood1]|nr:unnamed protein product [Rotaria sp. Silwood1]
MGSNISWAKHSFFQAGNFPALVNSGVALNYANIAPCGLVDPHMHPRATSVTYVVKGKLLTGFWLENGIDYVTNIVQEGQAVVFPKGSVHFELNIGCTPAVFIAARSNEDPGSLVATDYMQKFPLNVVAASLGENSEKTKHLVNDYVRQGLIVTTFSSSCSTIRTSTITSFTSIISLPVSSKINENNSTINEQQLILYWLLIGRLEQFQNYCFLSFEFHAISQIKAGFINNSAYLCTDSNVCHEKCRPIASYKPGKRIGELADS